MLPYIYQTENLNIGSYGVMLAIAYLTGRYLYVKKLSETIVRPINTEVLIFSLLLFGVIGAKLMFILKNASYAPITSLSSWTETSGFSSQGALFSALIVILVYSKITRIHLHYLLDAAAPAAILSYAIARLGCFLAGDDCWGVESQLPWAMSFPNGIKPTAVGQTVHPLPLYEIVYSLCIWQFLRIKQRTSQPPYQLFFYLLITWGGCRFLIEFISTNPIKLLGMTGSQFGALLMFLSSVLYFAMNNYYFNKKKPGK